MTRPFFSVIVSTYNRNQLLARCVQSCLEQTFVDFEIVVVDDGSTDGTAETLGANPDPRLRVVVHERNRGISPARHTGTQNARGEWLVVIDSDWAVFPHTLERLREIIAELPADVRVVRARMEWDNGRVAPSYVPAGVVDYRGWLEWWEQLARRGDPTSDMMLCMHRGVAESLPYFDNRRGMMEELWELNLAKREPMLFVADALSRQYSDAPNSHLRGAGWEQVPRLRCDAPDRLWMAQTALAEHGEALARHAPSQRHGLLRIAAKEAFLIGDRKGGIRYSAACLHEDKHDAMAWATLGLGLLGSSSPAYGALAYRRLMGRRAARR
jgi:Glycosyl transferase family 2